MVGRKAALVCTYQMGFDFTTDHSIQYGTEYFHSHCLPPFVLENLGKKLVLLGDPRYEVFLRRKTPGSKSWAR